MFNACKMGKMNATAIIYLPQIRLLFVNIVTANPIGKLAVYYNATKTFPPVRDVQESAAFR